MTIPIRAAAPLLVLALATPARGGEPRPGFGTGVEAVPVGGADRAGFLAGELARRDPGDLAGAEAAAERALAIEQASRPESLEAARLLADLALLAAAQGDLDTADERLARALALLEKLGAPSRALAACQLNRGKVAEMRGDLVRADERMAAARALYEAAAPESLELAAALAGLGGVALEREDWETAGLYHERARALRERLAPESEDVARSVEALGLVAERRGEIEAAGLHYRRALALYARAAPSGLEAARMGGRLAALALAGGDLATAEREVVRARGELEARVPGSLLAAGLAVLAGEVAERRGDLAAAERDLRQALAVHERLAPESTAAAAAWHGLGRVLWRAGRRQEGEEALCRAVERLDGQRSRLGGTAAARGGFGARHQPLFFACLAAQVDQGRYEASFGTLERGRARGFLDLLSERELVPVGGLPPPLERERRRLTAELDRLEAALLPLDPERQAAAVAESARRVAEIRLRHSEIAAELRRLSPRTAALREPRPLDLAAARAALEPGTVLLAYALGEERSFLFVVRPAGEPGRGIAVLPLAVGEGELRARVDAFRALVRRPESGGRAWRARGAALYDLLLAPAERHLRPAARLLFSPDGPLHQLPFAALVRRRRPLIDWKPFHTTLSATVYAGLRPAPRPAGESGEGALELLAFGDPLHPAAASGPVRATLGRGLDLAPLPFSRAEVEGVAALYPGARTFLGAEATEERAKAEAPRARRLHFACHAFLDARFPLRSGLALALPAAPVEGGENGLLQAWEIFEQVRVDADLVTLSACGTALGKEVGGEGLIGLTRAFHFAGARAVLATLWSVSDEGAARLMQRFYAGLRRGLPKDEALRAAQREEARAGAHPFVWAAFQLSGRR